MRVWGRGPPLARPFCPPSHSFIEGSMKSGLLRLKRVPWIRRRLSALHSLAASKGQHGSNNDNKQTGAATATGLLFAGFLGMFSALKEAKYSFGDTDDNGDVARSTVRILRREEVKRHRSLEDGVWVTYKDGVYDITNYLRSHPGGDEKLLMAAGEDLQSFWKLLPFQQHYTSPIVLQLLDEMKIGTLHPDDVVHISEHEKEVRSRKYPTNEEYDCIIVGAGVSGLQAAHTLVQEKGVDPKKVLLLEAHDCIGGRIRQIPDFIKGVNVELGGEFLHGSNTALTEFAAAQKEPISRVFVWAAGDGGPLEDHIDGGYALYYFKDRGLLRFDSKNKEFMRMNQTLWDLCFLDERDYSDETSLYDYLKGQGFGDEIMKYAEAGFANTLCASARGLSLKQCIQWQKLWHEEVK